MKKNNNKKENNCWTTFYEVRGHEGLANAGDI